MRKIWMATVAAGAMVAAAGTAQAGTYIPVPMVPGAVSEIAFSINNHNIVAGSYRDSANVEHGFFGPLAGSNWTTFDAPFDGTTGTEARSINDDGVIVGIATNPNFKVGEEFYRAPDGTFTVFTKDGVPLDGIAQGINKNNVSLGDYISPDGIRTGYTGKKGEYTRDFKLHLKDSKHSVQVSPRGITDMGVVTVGYYVGVGGIQHGFLQEYVGNGYLAGPIDYANSAGTALEDVNNPLVASGQWVDSIGNSHAFIIDLSKLQNAQITDLNPGDGSSSQHAWGINDKGLVAISTSTGESYIYCPKNKPEKCPEGGGTLKNYFAHGKNAISRTKLFAGNKGGALQ